MQYIKKEGGIRLIEKERKWDNKLPIVTIIIATFNSEIFLEQALLSIKKQTYPNIELIIFDGGSADNTLSILEKYSDIIEYWKSENDKGIYDAWNKALKVSSGKWISFIGSDDYFESQSINEYIEHIASLNFVPEFVSSKIRFIKENGDIIKVLGDSWSWTKFKRYMNTLHVGAFHNRSLFDRYGEFNIEYKICGDYELLLRAKDSLVTSFMPIVTANMRHGGMSTKRVLVLKEAFIVKVKTGGRNYLLALMEYWLSVFAFYIRRFKI